MPNLLATTNLEAPKFQTSDQPNLKVNLKIKTNLQNQVLFLMKMKMKRNLFQKKKLQTQRLLNQQKRIPDLKLKRFKCKSSLQLNPKSNKNQNKCLLQKLKLSAKQKHKKLLQIKRKIRKQEKLLKTLLLMPINLLEKV